MATDPDDLLAQEYALVQKLYEDFGARALTVKAWSVTFSATGLGLAYTADERVILLLAAASAAIFWFVEALLKAHQKAFLPRIQAIEAHFRGEEKLTAAMQINRAWRTSFDEKGRLRRGLLRAFWPHVALPHVLIILVGIALFWCWSAGERPAGDPPVELKIG